MDLEKLETSTEAPEPACAPPNAEPRASGRRWMLFLLVAGMTVALDLSSKYWAQHTLQYIPGRQLVVVENLAAFNYVRNPGAAWGFMSGLDESVRRPLFITISLGAMTFILVLLRRLHPSQRLLGLALCLVMGGAIGNFVDRLRYGYVVDFILLHWKSAFRWPTFNVADIAISVGVGLVLLEMILTARAETPSLADGAKPAPPEEPES